ncbi:MAG TPA: FecR domain-containing protein [Abditibacteriaceae bacterium]|jgi:prepilin-type N-terminal cleavage/methylation domain-containing protein
MKQLSSRAANNFALKRRGFTLLELVIVVGVLGVLAAFMFGSFNRGRATSRRAQCDVNLKGITLALDAYRAEHGTFPLSLTELVAQKYLPSVDALRCTADARENGSYDEYYVQRGPRDDAQLPILVCPLHEHDAGGSTHGAQAFVGRYTTQFAASPTILESATDTTVVRPDGRGEVAAWSGMPLRGGDRVMTKRNGHAKLRFADGSTATLSPRSDVTVLQSFLDGNANAPLYTLVRQTLGEAVYKVHHGSKFDVATPTVTAGARGTEFRIKVAADGKVDFYLIEGRVVLSTVQRSAWAPLRQTVSVVSGALNLVGLPGLGGLL